MGTSGDIIMGIRAYRNIENPRVQEQLACTAIFSHLFIL